MVVTLGQQYNVGEKPTVILYTYILLLSSHCYLRIQKYNGGFLPDIILLTLCDYIGEPLQTLVQPNPFD